MGTTVSDRLSANWKLTCSFATAAAGYVIAIGLLIHWGSSDLVLAALFGLVCGWAAGILLAPYSEEAKRFKDISKVASGLIGGYLLGKADKVYELLSDKDHGAPIVQNPMIFRGLFIGGCIFLITTITVFVARTYWQAAEEKA
jgi:hypothetical protein